MEKGIFWCVSGDGGDVELITVKAPCGEAEGVVFSSKSGENFNHKAEREKLGRKTTGGLPADITVKNDGSRHYRYGDEREGGTK